MHVSNISLFVFFFTAFTKLEESRQGAQRRKAIKCNELKCLIFAFTTSMKACKHRAGSEFASKCSEVDSRQLKNFELATGTKHERY